MWAPWRSEYVTDPDKGGCFLCDARDAKDDKAAGVLLRRGKTFVVQNRYPYTSGHLMIAPYRHVGHLAALDDDELCGMMSLVRDCEGVLTDAMKPHGLNVGINLGRTAGAGLVGHIHMHIVPRWEGDTNFMAVFADVGVISQGLEEQYELLSAAFARRASADES
jgi:ATP adenylyltransferase